MVRKCVYVEHATCELITEISGGMLPEKGEVVRLAEMDTGKTRDWRVISVGPLGGYGLEVRVEATK